MDTNGKVKIGIIGSQFQADIHATRCKSCRTKPRLVAVASPTPGNAEHFAKRFNIPRVFTDYREMLKDPAIEVVSICAPNSLHAQMTKDVAAVGKHVVCEKPLAMTIAEGEEMIAATKKAGVLLMYGEELLFTPKYLKVKEMSDAGAFGKIYLVKQSEKHFGPHSEWFWDVNRSGGGALMDLGCHGIAFTYWFLGRSPIKSVYCQMGTYVHGDKTKADDDVLCIVEFENGANRAHRKQLGAPRRHGRQDRSLRRSRRAATPTSTWATPCRPTAKTATATPSKKPPPQKVGRIPSSKNSGTTARRKSSRISRDAYAAKKSSRSTGEDGLVVLKALYAGYASAGEGRKLALPYQPPAGTKRPIDLWLNGPAYRQPTKS